MGFRPYVAWAWAREVLVDIQADVFPEHILGDNVGDMLAQSRVPGSHVHDQIESVSAAAAEVQNPQPFQTLFPGSHQIVQGRAQKNGGDKVLPESSDIVVFAQESVRSFILAGAGGLE